LLEEARWVWTAEKTESPLVNLVER
jgi:hypothetical protein